ncbi:MAG: hypothetical protein EOM34_09070 [Clostridia bacterium]|nr:hypothetical protein [Clostridia bacterium]
MKKNKMMRAASALMVATLLTTSVISGTFAKYVTSGNASDEARVAKWGVTVTATSSTMFSDTYKKTDTAYTLGDNTVVGEASAKVVAPGTSGNLTSVTLSGKPEVAVRVTNVATVDLKNWEVNGEYYCPLEVKVGETTIKGTAQTSVEAFKAAIKSAIEAYKADYEPGTNLSTKTDAAPVVSWKWAFNDNNDEKDTKLGDAATAATISITIKTTVTQID